MGNVFIHEAVHAPVNLLQIHFFVLEGKHSKVRLSPEMSHSGLSTNSGRPGDPRSVQPVDTGWGIPPILPPSFTWMAGPLLSGEPVA